MKKSTTKQIADAHRKSMELFDTFEQWAKGHLNPNIDHSNYQKAFELVKAERDEKSPRLRPSSRDNDVDGGGRRKNEDRIHAGRKQES